MNLRPLNSTHQAISCPQNGDRIVTVGTVASVYPMHIRVTYLLALTLLLRRTTLTASRQNRKKTVTSCFLFFSGRLKIHDLQMQDWKMTDNILANSEQNYAVWKMQDWKMTDKLLANC